MKTTIIGIAGGTGSGKSTFTDRIKNYFGDKIAIIYHDNYYKPGGGLSLSERKKVNYDHPDSLETTLLVEHLKQLKNGETIKSPIYDYSMHDRTNETSTIKPKKVTIVEGILALADESLRNMLDIKIFIEADADVRILRRILRDVKQRGRDIENIMDQYLTTVKPMHNLFVEPTKALADIVVNSGMNDIALDIIKTKIEKCLDS